MSLASEYLPAEQAAQQELVLLHGWGANREVWRPLLALLRPWANVTLVDIPGCAPGCAVEAEVDLGHTLQGILQSGPARAVYVGWSLGGQLALELAARFPERVSAVITVCSNPRFVAAGDWPGMAAAEFSDFFNGVQENPGDALKRFDTLQVAGSSRRRALLREWRKSPRAPACSQLKTGLEWLGGLDQRQLVADLTQPQLHLLAQHDELVPVACKQALADLVSQAGCGEVVLLAETCHLAPVASPALLQREIREFLMTNDLLLCNSTMSPEVDKADVAMSFSRAATAYDSVARLQRDVGSQLLLSLDRFAADPGIILDLGCGTGSIYPELQHRFPAAHYIGLDLASGMVNYARDRCPDDCDWVVADAEAIPLASESVNLVFSSLAIQWCYRPEHLFAELARILRPGGFCVFTSLGPGTLRELRGAWAAVDAHQHVNHFLQASQLQDAARKIPGIQLDTHSQDYRMEYQRVRDLLAELKTLGAHNMNRSRPAGLTGRRALQGMLLAYEEWREDGVLPATYDVIFGVLEKI